MIDAVFGYAPGKVILFGEHAVVYGQPAVAGTIDRGIRVAVSQRDGEVRDGPLFKSHSMGMRARPDPHGEGPEGLRKALGVLVDLYGARVRRLVLSAEGTIPAGAGLGSSAALSVALLRGVQRVLGEGALGGDALVERAFALERVFHGNPSGVDHTTIALGGCIAYRRAPAEGGQGDAVVERLTLPRRVRLAVAVAGLHGGTARAVSALRDRARRHQAAYQRVYEGIGALAVEGRAALEQGALAAVGELMDVNQGYLNALGVSTPAIEALCATARERGALGAKLSGAGGGGAVIALVEDDPAPIVRAFEAYGVPSFSTEIVDGQGPEAP
ncbi:MAG: mevalonate kinase [Deltaproteobacteria bacterium]|nr:mevalonate kinase [Deltaproteobacteria bacterium]